jgi:hypothetical protein
MEGKNKPERRHSTDLQDIQRAGIMRTIVYDLAMPDFATAEIHFTVRPDASTSSAQGTQSVSKGKTCINLGLRYLSPNGAIIANYGMLDKFISINRTGTSPTCQHNKGISA